jgi:uncharacterized transporter YbjL
LFVLFLFFFVFVLFSGFLRVCQIDLSLKVCAFGILFVHRCLPRIDFVFEMKRSDGSKSLLGS